MNRRLAVIVIIVVILIAGSVALAQNGEFEVPWYEVGGGGGSADDGGRLSLSGTIGQAETGVLSDGGSFVLSGGYWFASGSGSADEAVYIPLIIRAE
ncbi:MAG TPA: hypothetical protein VLE70_14675 [Anaerolineae bacterium]|jgi:hypothetical protein|nr:hypothetical protein [Anaerolineae bacterium]